MLVSRQCVLGGKPVTLQERRGVEALRGPVPMGLTPATPPADPVLLAEWRAFERAGYVFVEAFGGSSTLAGSFPLFQRGTRLLLGTRRVSARLKPELTDDRARAALSANGLVPVRQMKFAPNLFEAEATEGVDPLGLSERLSPGGDFVYVEPQFIELMGERDGR